MVTNTFILAFHCCQKFKELIIKTLASTQDKNFITGSCDHIITILHRQTASLCFSMVVGGEQGMVSSAAMRCILGSLERLLACGKCKVIHDSGKIHC